MTPKDAREIVAKGVSAYHGESFHLGEANGYLQGRKDLIAEMGPVKEALRGLVQAASDFDCQICGNGSCAETCERLKGEKAVALYDRLKGEA